MGVGVGGSPELRWVDSNGVCPTTRGSGIKSSSSKSKLDLHTIIMISVHWFDLHSILIPEHWFDLYSIMMISEH